MADRNRPDWWNPVDIWSNGSFHPLHVHSRLRQSLGLIIYHQWKWEKAGERAFKELKHGIMFHNNANSFFVSMQLLFSLFFCISEARERDENESQRTRDWLRLNWTENYFHLRRKIVRSFDCGWKMTGLTLPIAILGRLKWACCGRIALTSAARNSLWIVSRSANNRETSRSLNCCSAAEYLCRVMTKNARDWNQMLVTLTLSEALSVVL